MSHFFLKKIDKNEEDGKSKYNEFSVGSVFLVRFSRPRIQKVLHRIEFYKRRGWGEKEEHRGGRDGHFAVIGRLHFSNCSGK